MFIGHYALGLAAKRLAPAASLGTLFLGAQLADLVWPTLVLAGVERVRIEPGATVVTPLAFDHYPWSHSLAALALWGLALGLGHRLLRRGKLAVGALLAALVVSHWALDWIVHRPDLPLAPGGAGRFGLELWSSLPATLLVELGLFAAGVEIYRRSTAARDRTGTWALVALVAFLVAVELANLLGPPPPSVAAIGWAGQAMWLLVAWGAWVDRHRAPRAPA